MRINWTSSAFPAAFATLVITTGVAFAQPALPKLPGTGVGKTKVQATQSYSGTSLSRPAGIAVYDFAFAQTGADESSARKVAAAFSAELIKHLSKSGFPVTHGVAGQPPRENYVAVQGVFQLLNKGDKLLRMGIGFGAGASKVKAHVELHFSQSARDLIVSEFEAIAQSGKKPGALFSMGAGAAPAAAAAVSGAADQKQTVDGDAARMAKELSRKVIEAMAVQGWV